MCETEPSAERQGQQHTAGEGKIYVNKCALLLFIMPSNRAAILSTYRDLLELLRPPKSGRRRQPPPPWPMHRLTASNA